MFRRTPGQGSYQTPGSCQRHPGPGIVGGAPQMGGDYTIVQSQKLMVRWQRLGLKHIQPGSPNLPVLQRLVQGLLIDHRASGRVYQNGCGLHQGEFLCAHKVPGLSSERAVQCHIKESAKIKKQTAANCGLRLGYTMWPRASMLCLYSLTNCSKSAGVPAGNICLARENRLAWMSSR